MRPSSIDSSIDMAHGSTSTLLVVELDRLVTPARSRTVAAEVDVPRAAEPVPGVAVA